MSKWIKHLDSWISRWTAELSQKFYSQKECLESVMLLYRFGEDSATVGLGHRHGSLFCRHHRLAPLPPESLLFLSLETWDSCYFCHLLPELSLNSHVTASSYYKILIHSKWCLCLLGVIKSRVLTLLQERLEKQECGIFSFFCGR